MRTAIAILIFIILTGCRDVTYLGNDVDGYKEVPENNISVIEAIEISTPYVNEIFIKQFSQATRENKSLIWRVHIAQKGSYYYIHKDFVTSKSLHKVEKHTVRVSVKNGNVLLPNT